ncbi:MULTISPECIES: hypothetical protein [unclassified Streptomyces]|uniref:hypothetical protein n=1 Tax=unclassified Streptomyces TaxID=2593676 RepID=UPI0008849E04|nr:MULTISPECIES: hypothetical protein [unclassified Streptomyces]PBC72318.1 hypothetical protein BX261_7402 [Streptomyces sp. 2321.6]SDR62184.1 hypothetical protein SAMN05216511_7301 [Streptomyces sp. KS_16]SEE50905.1 hypothetical protein SAMN05428940_7350 [Streptomyces sp. 2133.1]SNC77822.1 hypothetical protein SAMN06272741_7238 [Streptomyces sp. 2114.4]
MDSREAAKARVRAKVAAEKALPASERIANMLHATHTHAEAQALLDEVRAEARREGLREAEVIAERSKEKHFKFGNYDTGHGAWMVADSIRIHLGRIGDAGSDSP